MSRNTDLDKALTLLSDVIKSVQGGRGAYATLLSGSGSDPGQHVDSPLGNKSKKTKEQERRQGLGHRDTRNFIKE